MASIDDLEASQAKESSAAPVCPATPVVIRGACGTCEFNGPTEGGKTWTNGAGQKEPMRYCYNFCTFVPARTSFGCSLYQKAREKG